MAACPRDPYFVLEVPHGASFAEIRTAYLKLALRAHPDKGGTKEQFQAAVAAFESLASDTNPCVSYARNAKVEAPNPSRSRGEAADLLKRSHKRSSWPAEHTASQSKESRCFGTGMNTKERVRCRSVGARLERAICHLRNVLTAMTDQQRYHLLIDFSPRVRHLLVEFMEKEKNKTGHTTTGASLIVSSFDADVELSDGKPLIHADEDGGANKCSIHSAIHCTMDSLSSEVLALEDWPPMGFASRLTYGIADEDGRRNSRSGARAPASGFRGIRRTRGSRNACCMYQAFIMIQRIVVASRAMKSLEVAVHWHTVLVHMRRLVYESDVNISLETRLRSAIDRSCAEACVAQEHISLSFCGICPLYFLIGRHIATGFSVDLHGVIAQYTRMELAKRSGWSGIRHIWIETMQSLLAQREHARGNARGRQYTPAEAEKLADDAWESYETCRERAERRKMFFNDCQSRRVEYYNCIRNHRESHLRKTALRAASAVESLSKKRKEKLIAERLQSNLREQKQAKRIAEFDRRERRRVRRKWDKMYRHLPMVEILRGPLGQ